MPIQWFPGHMASARKKAAETMASIDVVIEVVDARLPEASTNPMVRELREYRQRPCLKVLNKADLEPSWEIAADDISDLSARGWRLVRTSAKTGDGVSEAFDTLARLIINT